MVNDKDMTLPEVILDALALYLKEEAIKFYQSDEGQKFYEEYQKEKTVKDVNDTNDKSKCLIQ